MESKVCTRCNVDKLLTEYFKTKRSKDGLQPACKSCMNISYKASRGKKQEHYNAVCNNRRLALTQKIREWKEERGCCLCDEKFGPCLELHHTDVSDKDFDPSEASNKSWSAFLKEAEKCVVVCANCHRKVHHGILVI